MLLSSLVSPAAATAIQALVDAMAAERKAHATILAVSSEVAYLDEQERSNPALLAAQAQVDAADAECARLGITELGTYTGDYIARLHLRQLS